MAKRELPTAAYVRSILHYDPLTGVFTWRERPREHFKTQRAHSAWNARYAGGIAGSVSGKGYVQIMIDGRSYRANRVAWLMVTGKLPKEQIDHRDLVKSNNSWRNLREATNSQNQANSGRRRCNTSGFKGVHWHKQAGKWRAEINHLGNRIRLGLFVDAGSAHAAYQEAAERYFGEFARVA